MEENENKNKNKTEEEIVQSLAQMMSTESQIAAYLNQNVDEVRLKHMALIEKGWERGRIAIRQMQFDLAKKGNVEMIKLLGRDFLGQS